jgi:uncharacterized Zn finger protein (UPF0148 family)
MTSRFVIKKGLLGGHSVAYECPKCSTGLKSPLDEAGKSDTCPQCGTQFVVPGTEERDRIRQEEQVAKLEKEQKAEAARRQKELHEAAERELQTAKKRAEQAARQSQSTAFADPPVFEGPFEYRMVQIPPAVVVDKAKGREAADYLERVVNDHAQKGWEFYRIDDFTILEKPGCLLALFNVPPTAHAYYVVTFRRAVS